LTHLSLRSGFLGLSARETAKPQALNVESRRLASKERIVEVSSHGSRHCLLISARGSSLSPLKEISFYPRTVLLLTSSKSVAIGDSSIRTSISHVCFTTTPFAAFQSRKSVFTQPQTTSPIWLSLSSVPTHEHICFVRLMRCW
jgi:hypothetical protein